MRLKKAISRIDQNWFFLLIVSAAVSAVFLLFASPYTTPLNRYYGYDSAFFLLIGKGIRHGMLPYLDLYDQKGPMIFYINALGYLLTDSRLGVFLLQVVFMTGVLFVLWKFSRLFLGRTGSAAVLLLFLLLFCGTVKEGDMTEEWSLIFSVLPMYLSVRFVRSGRELKSHPGGYSVIYGICLAVLALFRLTNACLVGGLVLGFTILLCLQKEFRALWINALLVLAGAAAVLVPVCLYFQKIGAMEMFLYASLLHNFHYAVDGAAEKTVLDWVILILSVGPILLTLIMTPWFLRRGVTDRAVMVLLNSAGLVGAMAMTVGYGWRHYYLLVVPAILADACVWLRWIASLDGTAARRRILALVLCAAFFAPYAPQTVRHVGKSILYNVFHQLDGEVARYQYVSEYIPAGTEGVWGYNVPAKEYLYLDILPCYRYFALQEWMAEADPFIREEIDTMLHTDPPQCVFLPLEETEMRRVLEEECGFECVAEIGSSLALAIYQR